MSNAPIKLLSFDPLRALDVPDTQHIKPEAWLSHRARIRAADWILFPEYWQVNTLIYGFRKAIFPSPSSYHLGHDKVEMTRAFEAIFPLHVPTTLIRPATPAGIEEILDTLTLPFIVKEPRSSMGRGVNLMESCRAFIDYAAERPILYAQEYLPVDRDLRVVVVGRDVVCAYWRIAPTGELRNNVAQGAATSFDDVPDQAIQLVQNLSSHFGIDHAGFDVAIVDGHCQVLEFNVMFGTEAVRRQGIALGPRVHTYLASLRSNAPAPDCDP